MSASARINANIYKDDHQTSYNTFRAVSQEPPVLDSYDLTSEARRQPKNLNTIIKSNHSSRDFSGERRKNHEGSLDSRLGIGALKKVPMSDLDEYGALEYGDGRSELIIPNRKVKKN